MSNNKKNLSHSTMIRKYNVKNPLYKLFKQKKFQSLMVVTFSAVVIGAALGMIMLNMIVSVDDYHLSTAQSFSSNNNKTDNKTVNSERNEMNHSDSSLKKVISSNLSAFVVQGGVFSDLTNANEISQMFTQIKYPSIVWERENKFYIIVGISATEEDANQMASELADSGHEIFTKKWETIQRELTLTEEEEDWIQLFEEIWFSTLHSSKEEKTVHDNWEDVLSKVPNSNNAFGDFAIEAKQILHKDGKILTHMEKQELLLNLWMLYEKIIIQS